MLLFVHVTTNVGPGHWPLAVNFGLVEALQREALRRGVIVSVDAETEPISPYEFHDLTCDGRRTQYSPNSVDLIEECDCGFRVIHNPCIGHPVTLC